jgi:hypothetical protein
VAEAEYNDARKPYEPLADDYMQRYAEGQKAGQPPIEPTPEHTRAFDEKMQRMIDLKTEYESATRPGR